MDASLSRLLSFFWDGEVAWSSLAQSDLEFWLQVDFASLCSPISADTFEAAMDAVHLDPTAFAVDRISFLASDASDTACGGGLVRVKNGQFQFAQKKSFFSNLPRSIRDESSTLREMTAIWWMLLSFKELRGRRVVVFTDSRSARDALRSGSKRAKLQKIARAVFIWCIQHGVILCPCWLSRDEPIMVNADARSRWHDKHGERTPAAVFLEAQRMATSIWGRALSFDRMATHLNAMPPPGMGPRLPFYSFWNQPGCAGVDVFSQPISAWRGHISFVHPPAPLTGRVVSFLQSTRARSVIVVPDKLARSGWWSQWLRRGGPGVRAVSLVHGFRVVAVDHRIGATPEGRP